MFKPRLTRSSSAHAQGQPSPCFHFWCACPCVSPTLRAAQVRPATHSPTLSASAQACCPESSRQPLRAKAASPCAHHTLGHTLREPHAGPHLECICPCTLRARPPIPCAQILGHSLKLLSCDNPRVPPPCCQGHASWKVVRHLQARSKHGESHQAPSSQEQMRSGLAPGPPCLPASNFELLCASQAGCAPHHTQACMARLDEVPSDTYLRAHLEAC